MVPETDLARARRWVERHNDSLPERAWEQVRYELDVADRHLTVVECRAAWRAGSSEEWTRLPIVRFHYVKARREWSTYWRDRNLKFHRYDPFPPTRRWTTCWSQSTQTGRGSSGGEVVRSSVDPEGGLRVFLAAGKALNVDALIRVATW